MAYPNVELEAQVLIVEPVYCTEFTVQRVTEYPGLKVDAVIIVCGQYREVSILNEENYFSNWSDEDVTAAIVTYLSENVV